MSHTYGYYRAGFKREQDSTLVRFALLHQKRILHKSGYSGSAANCQPLNQEQRESTTFRFADFTSCEWFTESDKPSVILVQKEKVWLLCERVRTKISDDYFKIIIL